MKLFSFSKTEKKPMLLIDIGSASIAGSYALIDKNQKPELYYSARVPIRSSRDRNTASEMEKALSRLMSTLVRKGAPVFARETGSGSVRRVVISVASPWQETHTHIEHIIKDEPFRFTHHMLDSIVKETNTVLKNRTSVAEMVIATRLNGYYMDQPFEKDATEAKIFILSASIATEIIETIQKIIREALHTSHIEVLAFTQVMFLTLRDIYTENKNFLIMDVSGDATDFLVIKDGILLKSASIPHGLNELRQVSIEAGFNGTATDDPIRAIGDSNLLDKKNNHFADAMYTAIETWKNSVTGAFQTLQTKYALPRDILLLADKSAYEFLEKVLVDSDFHPLGLSDDTLKVHYIDSGQLEPYVKHRAEATGDTFLSLLALYLTKDIKTLVVHHLSK